MSTYVMSDIHGCFDELQAILAKTGFSESDELILAGDLIERGPKNYEMLRWLEEKKENVIPLLGNHEEEFIQNISRMESVCTQEKYDPADPVSALMIHHKLTDRSLYFDYYESIKELLVEHDACLADLMRWAKMFRTWPTQYTIRVRGREFIIVHAGYIEDLELLPDPGIYSGIKDFNLYAREDAFIYGGKAHATIIAGHTPTIIRHSFAYNCGKVFRYHDEENNCVLYDIDCGSVFRYWGEKEARLACICLEDESITYL